jgi:ribokinase
MPVVGEQQAAASPALVVVGSISRDRITSAAGQAHETAGGAGLYAGLGAVAAGIRPAMAGIVSDDLPGTIIDALAVRAEVTGLRRVLGRRLRFEITYDATGYAQYRVDDARAEELISPQSVLDAYPGLRAAHLCPTGAPHAQPDLAEMLRNRAGGESVFLSATMFRDRILAEPRRMADLVRMVDVLVCSAEDALLLADTTSLRDAIGALTPAGPRPGAVCVTDAGRGAYLLRHGCLPLVIPACPADVTDPTGAGESFAGALAARLVAGTDPVSAARAAARVAAVTVTGWGPEALLAVTPRAWAAAGDPDVRRPA